MEGVPVRRERNVILDVGEVWTGVLGEKRGISGALGVDVGICARLEKVAGTFCSGSGHEGTEGEEKRHDGRVGGACFEDGRGSILCGGRAWRILSLSCFSRGSLHAG